jgi:hypothetical protein
MGIAVSNRVIARNGIGRFIAACEDAGHDTVEILIERGATASKGMAPVRSGRLKGSIESHMTGATSGVWQADAPYAMFQEEGTSAHTMIGSPFFRFFWETRGRMWVPGLYGIPDVIDHPGNKPQPFLRPAYEMIMAQAMAVAKSQYPG